MTGNARVLFGEILGSTGTVLLLPNMESPSLPSMTDTEVEPIALLLRQFEAAKGEDQMGSENLDV
jgi:hypothetical protein